MTDRVRVGIVNTGWWADAMYLPALAGHPQADVVAACGRNRERSEAFVARWGIPHLFADYRALVTSGLCDALIVAASHDVHYEMTMAALENGLHVLCEKPLARTVAEAAEMAALAETKGLRNAVPFTYRYMPPARHIKTLIDDGYIGRPYHLNIRFYHSFGRKPGYFWKWDLEKAGSGDLGNLASHPIYLAFWYFGPIDSVCAELNQTVERGTLDLGGKPFTQADDNGVLILRFANGALGSIHYSSVAYESSVFQQQHFMEFHGSQGTLYSHNDWDEKQETIGARDGEPLQPLVIPDDVWGQANIRNVHESYKAVFRRDGHMVGSFIDSILNGRDVSPTFRDGLRVQEVMAAAQLSAATGRRVSIGEVACPPH